MGKPNFFIIGAPKCGTTSMARWLGEHPQVFISPIKEPHYFSTDLANRVVVSSRRYKRLFRKSKEEHKAIGEASTWYLFSKEAVSRIERTVENAKYIVMTRDPSDMCVSLYQHNLRTLHEDSTTLERALELQAYRLKGNYIPKACREPYFLQYQEACALGTMLERLLEVVPRERVLHISLDRLQLSSVREYRRVLSFLDLEDDGRRDFPVENAGRGVRSILLQKFIRYAGKLRVMLGINKGFGFSRFNEKKEVMGKVSPDVRSRLQDIFSEEKKKLDYLTKQLQN